MPSPAADPHEKAGPPAEADALSAYLAAARQAADAASSGRVLQSRFSERGEDLVDLIATGGHRVLIGRPGSGKSALLRMAQGALAETRAAW